MHAVTDAAVAPAAAYVHAATAPSAAVITASHAALLVRSTLPSVHAVRSAATLVAAASLQAAADAAVKKYPAAELAGTSSLDVVQVTLAAPVTGVHTVGVVPTM